MNIIVPIKVLADDQDIVVAADRSLDDSKAHRIVSTYDLNAIEAAVQLASTHEGSKVVCVSVADAKADDSKLKKGILARGVDELVMIADDACADLDAHATAAMLARLVDGLDAADLIVCGDGSADNYAQQVDVQLADALGLPVVTAVSAVSVEGAVATCDRMLETQLQTVQVDLPAVISVVPDIALPRIPGMKDILAAGKKPSSVNAASDVAAAVVDVVETKAPQQAERKMEVLDASVDGDLEKFAAASKRPCRKGDVDMKACVIAETSAAARALCAGARGMADEVVLIAPGVEALTGVADKAVHIDVPSENAIDDAYASVNSVVDAEAPGIVLVEPTRSMKVLAGRLAAHLGTATITDVIEFEGDLATTMYFGGVGQRKSKASGTAIYTVGAGVFDEASASGTDVVEEAPFTAPARALRVTGTKDLPKSDVDLAAASVVVAGGRGFAEEADLQLMRDVAAKLGGECGCSRPLAEGVDWMPREAYIGVSGMMLAPKMYLGIGISGQMQHMVGVNHAGTMFAVNKDKNAPIFKQCDYGLVGDLKDVLPKLAAAL